MDPFISADDLGVFRKTSIHADDDLAIMAIDIGCQAVRDYIRQDVNLVLDDEIRLAGSGTPNLLLPQLPVVGVSQIVLDDDTVDSTDYEVDWYGAVALTDGTYWPRSALTVTYSHGWATTEEDVIETPGSGDPGIVERVPSTLRRVALLVAARFYRVAGSGGTNIRQETIGAYSRTVSEGEGDPGDLTATEKAALTRYVVKRRS